MPLPSGRTLKDHRAKLARQANGSKQEVGDVPQEKGRGLSITPFDMKVDRRFTFGIFVNVPVT